MKLLIFAVTGILLFVLFRLLNRLSNALVKKIAHHRAWIKIIPIIELAAWFAYAFWGAYVIFFGHVYYDIIVGAMALLIIFGLAWFVFRDFLAGVLIKIEKALDVGQHIKTPFAEGHIKKLGTLSVELINDAGELVKIPYSQLSRETLIMPPDDEDSLPHQLTLPLSGEQHPEKMRDGLYDALVAMPYIISPMPAVKLLRTKNNKWELQVKYHTHMRSQAVIVEQKIREMLAGNNQEREAVKE